MNSSHLPLVHVTQVPYKKIGDHLQTPWNWNPLASLPLANTLKLKDDTLPVFRRLISDAPSRCLRAPLPDSQTAWCFLDPIKTSHSAPALKIKLST